MDIFSLFGKMVFSVGGAGVIILGLSSWIGKIWADKLMQSLKKQNQKEIEEYKLKLAEQLEILKAKNDKLNYISKTQFDAEFKMYQELSKAIYILINTIKKFDQSQTIANVAYIKIAQSLSEETKKAFQIFEQLLFQYAPFIQEKIFLICEHFRIVVFTKFISFHMEELFNEDNIMPRILKISKNFDSETREIFLLHKEIIEALRKYLSTLKIQEG
ncbi:MAG: hypothetical protein ACI4S3_07025 [Candidatus Gastranaerophilaceae bacterium]